MSRIRVRGYRRQDGTWVRPHTRSKPTRVHLLSIVAMIAVALLIGGFVWLLHDTPSTQADPLIRVQHAGLTLTQEETSETSSCALNAYGLVSDYLQRHPCESMTRTLYTADDQAGHIALVAVANVRMPDKASMEELKTLADKPGTGNIQELSGDVGRFDSVRFTGNHYRSTSNDTTVVISQAEPWSGNPSVEILGRSADAGIAASSSL